MPVVNVRAGVFQDHPGSAAGLLVIDMRMDHGARGDEGENMWRIATLIAAAYRVRGGGYSAEYAAGSNPMGNYVGPLQEPDVVVLHCRSNPGATMIACRRPPGSFLYLHSKP